MIDELNDLAGALRALREPVVVAPGLLQRAMARRRKHRVHVGGGAAAVILVAMVVIAASGRSAGRTVTFAISAPSVHSVALVGDFTEWRSDRVQLAETSGGIWQATVRLPPGRYRFAYLVDRGEWRADTHAASAPDDFGRPTSVLTVAEH